MTVGSFERHGNSCQRIIDGTANSKFTIHATEASRFSRQQYMSDQFARKQPAVILAIAGIELVERNLARAVGSCDFNGRVETEQSWRRISGKCGPALRSARSDVAEIAVFLDAEAAALAPSQRLVVPEATRVEADVAPDGTHITQNRRGNRGGGFSKDRKMLAQV